MTIKNDFEVTVFGDPVQEEAIAWIEGNTAKDGVFLTNWGGLYTVPTLAGRGVYLGYDPWAGSAGYDVEPRKATITAIYSAGDKTTACRLLEESGIDYVFIGPAERTNDGRFALNEAMFTGEFVLEGQIDDANGAPVYQVFGVGESCRAGA
jgi:uncharacterized membrane protein